jgi:ribosomal protein L11 methyltransferase
MEQQGAVFLDRDLYAVEVYIQEKAGLLKEQIYCLLENLNIPVSGICEKEIPDGYIVWFYTRSRHEALSRTNDITRKLTFPAKVSFRGVNDDWKSRDSSAPRRFLLNGEIEIILKTPGSPAGAGEKSGTEKKTILLDEDLVFGTGEHPTTVYMSGFIGSVKTDIRSFFDAGCGTGILSLIAACYGIEDIVCQDVDPAAVQNTTENFRVNFPGLARIYRGDIKDTRPDRRFDMVSANLFSLDLVDLREKLISLVNPGKYLAVSGISVDNADEVAKAFRSSGVLEIDEVRGPEWAAFLYTVPAL